MNSLHLVGRLTKNPELLNSGSSGKSYCSFVLAVDRQKSKDANGANADFPRLTAFGTVAENMVKFLSKGSLVAVDGVVRTDNYEKDGKQVSRTELIARNIQFLSSNQSENTENRV